MTVKYNLENVNPDLYDELDDLAMETVGFLEKQLAEKMVAVDDATLEELYDNIRVKIINSVLDHKIQNCYNVFKLEINHLRG